MGDIEEAMFTPSRQKKCLGCFACLGVISIVIFSVAMTAYVHLGPDDQVLIKTSRGRRVVNGPGGGQLNPFQEREFRKATLLDSLQYAVVQDYLTAVLRNEVGPKLLFLGPNDVIVKTMPKIVLEKDEFIRYTDKMTGVERVEQGPGTIVPAPTEVTDAGIEKVVSLNVGTAVEVRNKLTGARTLVTACDRPTGIFVPDPSEEIVEVRSLIHVLPHEAMIVRDVDGKMTVYSGRSPNAQQEGQCGVSSGTGVGGTAFFLKPYSKIVRMSWSTYANPAAVAEEAPAPAPSSADENSTKTTPADDAARRLSEVVEDAHYIDQASPPNSSPKRKVASIDLRTQKSFFRYEVRTSDNVKLEMEGTIFWQIEDVGKMIVMTADPEGDVWARSRSTLIGAVSTSKLGNFMENSGSIVEEAFASQVNETFFSDRGIKLVSMEMTKYSPVDQHTQDTLQHIIRQTVQRINDLQKQRSENDVMMEKLEADILLERNRTILIQTQALNSRLLAETAGEVDGGKVAHSIGAFIDGLNESLSNLTARMELFRHHKMMQSSKIDTQQLSSGSANLYLAPKDMELRLQMPTKTEL